MTINVALVTTEALVFGCDSTASTTAHYLDPFHFLETDKHGKLKLDDDNRLIAKFSISDVQSVVTNAWGGVTKMFQISESPVPVVAVTAGTAKLNERTMASLGAQFRKELEGKKRKLVSVSSISNAFLRFFRKQYDQHYANSPLPEVLREGPEFLIGGYGRDARFPELFRVKVQENSVDEEFSAGKSGASWNGQADAVERLMKGVDGAVFFQIKNHIESLLKKHHDNMKERMLQIISEVLERYELKLPEDINTTLPETVDEGFSLDRHFINTDFSNLPLQEAVNMASYLVFLQAGKARFERGVATVGGRIHVGVVTKEDGFRVLNAPKLAHRYTGFSDDPQ